LRPLNASWTVANEPSQYPPLVDFCCGKDGEAAHEVNRTARRLWSNTTVEPQVAVVLVENDVPRFDNFAPLIGLCGVGARVLEVPSPIDGLDDGEEGGYIVAFGIDSAYQGRKMADGSRPGNALLEGALHVVKAAFPGGRMRFVKAKILSDNRKSSRLFDEHGFDDLGIRGHNAVAERDVFRPPGLSPSFRRAATWSEEL
jgi:hypothetical protein